MTTMTLEKQRPADVGDLMELRFLTESAGLMDLHRDVHSMMGSTDNQRNGWIFCWDDCGGRRAVTIRARGATRPGFTRFPMPQAGESFRFSLAVRALHRQTLTRIETLVDREELPAWLAARTPGMVLTDLSCESTTAPFGRRGRPSRLFYWDVSGRAVIDDPVAAAPVFADGIGRNRGFGFGMISPY